MIGGSQVSNRAWREGWTCLPALLPVLVVVATLLVAGDIRSDDNATAPLRFAFASSSLFPEVPESDAKAALRVWARALGQDRGIPVDPEAFILHGMGGIADAMREKRVDAVSLLTAEYWKLGKDVLTGPFILGASEGRVTEEYVLLVHQESGIKGVGDLRGRSLIFCRNPRTSLAPTWLDVTLAKSGLPRSVELCGRVAHVNKVSQAVLPVFFRKSDACVVTRRGFETMSELNPQVGRQLKVLALSPEVVPSMSCFRKDYTEPTKEKLLAEIDKIHTTPAGHQVLTIFQCERLEVHPVSCLDSALQLLSDHSRFFASSKGTRDGKND